MKILQIFNAYRQRGGEEAWVDSIPELLGDSAIVEDLRFSSTDWIGPKKPSLFKQVLLMGNNPSSRASLRTHLARIDPDILLFHNVIPVGSLGLYFEAKKIGIPVLQYTHNFRPFSPSGTLWNGKSVVNAAMHGNPWPEILSGAWQGSPIKTGILAWHLKQARRHGLLDCIDHWLAISDFMRQKFIIAGVPEDKISVLRHCSMAPESAQPEVHQDSHYLYLGRLVPEKGIDSLIQAWKLLSNKLGNDCPDLVIAGTGPLENQVRQAAEELPKIHYAGFVDGEQKEKLIQQSKSVMVPSVWWEPLGLTTYESYAHARPVIASWAGGLKETVIDGVTGWCHEPGNPNDIARAVVEAEKCGPTDRQKRGSEGYHWLKKHADPIIWKDRFLSICRDAIEKRSSSKV